MTTLSLFQKYELRKAKFKPGSVWRDKGSHTIKELMIVSSLGLNEYMYEMYQGESNITFRILDSLHGRNGAVLSIGKLASWSTEYMEKNYEVVLDD